MVTRLVRELAERNLIPVPVLTEPAESFDPYELARRKFIRHVDPVLGSEQEADAIWRRARSTHDLVVLLDGVDDEIVGEMHMVAEGVKSCPSVLALAEAHGVEMPITEQVVEVCHHGRTVGEALTALMQRDAKPELAP